MPVPWMTCLLLLVGQAHRTTFLPLDWIVEVISDVLDDLITSTVRLNERVEATNRQCERQEQ